MKCIEAIYRSKSIHLLHICWNVSNGCDHNLGDTSH
jgi:hypothetical protein